MWPNNPGHRSYLYSCLPPDSPRCATLESPAWCPVKTRIRFLATYFQGLLVYLLAFFRAHPREIAWNPRPARENRVKRNFGEKVGSNDGWRYLGWKGSFTDGKRKSRKDWSRARGCLWSRQIGFNRFRESLVRDGFDRGNSVAAVEIIGI